MKKYILNLLFISGFITTVSCTDAVDNVATDNDRLFLESARLRNLADLQAGQIARTRGTSPEIRNFGELLIKQSSELSEELAALSEKKNLSSTSMLTSDQQEEVNLLIKAPEVNFNLLYLNTLSDSRIKAIDLYEQQVRKGQDNELRSWASSKLPVLRQQMEKAQTLIRNYNTMTTTSSH